MVDQCHAVMTVLIPAHGHHYRLVMHSTTNAASFEAKFSRYDNEPVSKPVCSNFSPYRGSRPAIATDSDVLFANFEDRDMRFVRALRRIVTFLLVLLSLVSCAFDVITIRQQPTRFEAAGDSGQIWILAEGAKIELVEGHATELRKSTRWHKVGRIEHGDVFHTTDQIVAVEASNQHEADLVVSNGMAVGFYLLVERTFTPASRPTAIKLSPS